MDLNIFIRQIIVHDTSDPAPGPGDYDVWFQATPVGGNGATDAAAAVVYRSERWRGAVRRGEHGEVLLWIEGIPGDATAGGLRLSGQGVEHDPLINDTLYGGVAVLDALAEAGTGRWLRTTNGRHFDFVFAVTPAASGHAARPLWTGEVFDAPGPAQPGPELYPLGS